LLNFLYLIPFCFLVSFSWLLRPTSAFTVVRFVLAGAIACAVVEVILSSGGRDIVAATRMNA